MSSRRQYFGWLTCKWLVVEFRETKLSLLGSSGSNCDVLSSFKNHIHPMCVYKWHTSSSGVTPWLFSLSCSCGKEAQPFFLVF